MRERERENVWNCLYWVVRKVRAAKDLNLINEIKNLNLLRFNFPSKSARTFRTTQYFECVMRISAEYVLICMEYHKYSWYISTHNYEILTVNDNENFSIRYCCLIQTNVQRINEQVSKKEKKTEPIKTRY